MSEERSPSLQGSFFAPPGRATPAEVSEQVGLCLDDPVTHAVLEAVDCYAVILNAQRQILAANPVLLAAIEQEDPEACRGLRLGESLGCTHADKGPDGCGSSRACRRCGALLSVLATQTEGRAAAGECLISMQGKGGWESHEFAARSMPMTVAGHKLTLLTLRDISAEKRRETLERLFIHDLLNSVQGLQGWTEILQGAGADATTIAERILGMASHLTAEVESQRRLLMAERGELTAEFQAVSPAVVLEELGRTLGAKVAGRLVFLPVPADVHTLRTDLTILCRVLGNMVTNALEAMPPGGQAHVWAERRGQELVFVVQNPGCMEPDVVDRVFQRSYSTKATRGRGLGTYGMKLLGEGLLGGKVGFTTSWEDGTRFFIELPLGG